MMATVISQMGTVRLAGQPHPGDPDTNSNRIDDAGQDISVGSWCKTCARLLAAAHELVRFEGGWRIIEFI